MGHSGASRSREQEGKAAEQERSEGCRQPRLEPGSTTQVGLWAPCHRLGFALHSWTALEQEGCSPLCDVQGRCLESHSTAYAISLPRAASYCGILVEESSSSSSVQHLGAELEPKSRRHRWLVTPMVLRVQARQVKNVYLTLTRIHLARA